MTFPPPRSSRSATAPPPISNIPPLDLPFQGRDDQIARLLELFEQYGHVLLHDGVALVQGFGKTQVAIAYCRAYTRRYDVAWWFSCRGETDDDRLCGLLEEQYQELREERARTFGAKVEHRPDNRWLFVYDDVSNPDRVYEHFVPGTGHRLVTSRSCGETWGSNRLELGGMTVEQSSRLLLDQAENLSSKQAKHLASLMNGHPAQLLAVAEEVRRTSYEECARMLTPAPQADPDTPPGGMLAIPRPRDDASGAPLSVAERRTLVAALARSPVGRDRDRWNVWLEAVRQMIKPTELAGVSDGGHFKDRIISVVNFALAQRNPKVMQALADALDLWGDEEGIADVRRLVDKAVDAWNGDQGR
ncbi:hypothetical protein GCM10010306_082140 [Streptomyces umbrinus]|uniref:Uncharacterized protein n=1 Tax=Streptomyces phaeochromogenes TaxID=1923 RepID=A0ABZ1HGC9_STRPH|nr:MULTISPECIES: hypothetical protein [Streptomyces phaeochromogenes group]WSD16622.1 hypothetical protein OHB35_27130 [Streptomyces phaeochromogenes]GHB75849.1 hypothetical protein GCM10010306_082140 [Streptomyces umbrinus]